MDPDVLEQRAKAFDFLFDSVVVTDMQGIIKDWNRGSEVLYGYSKQQAIGQPVSILHVPEDSERVTQQVISAVAQKGQWTGEIRMLRKDGSIGWIESMCVPIFNDGQQMIGALGVNRDITARIAETERLQRIAHYDQLTEIPNRYLLFDRIKHLIAQAKRNNGSFTLLYLDLDKFKNYNDTHGHAFGDLILQEAARRLSQSIRSSDTLARVGGDEFVILLENSEPSRLVAIVEKLQQQLAAEMIISGQSCYIECSVGTSIYPQDGVSADALLAAADKAMYLIKQKHHSTTDKLLITNK